MIGKMLKLSWISAALLMATLTLAACESSEERAQKHYEAGLELLEQGDVARALVEFRNVFKLNPEHLEARLAFARTQKEQGARGEAYSQYLRVVEQSPEMLEPRVELAEMAIDMQNWEEAERHGRAAIELAPDDPRVKIIGIALDYALARRDENPVQASLEADAAKAALAEYPDSLIALRIVVDGMLASEDFDGALVVIESGLEHHKNDLRLHAAKLQLLQQKRDLAGVGETLREMVGLFPDNKEISKLLIAWYIDQKDMDGAEAFLRELASAPDADGAAKMTVVRFLMETKGEEAAREELTRLIAAEEDNIIYRTLLASMDFEAGEQDKAISAMEALVADQEPTEQVQKAKIVLARMLLQAGDKVGARARVEEVIADDASNVDALKMRAVWLIDEDKPDDAVLDLRTALTQSPRDADIMTLMARAHERAGARELAGERYALAVEVSEKAVAESLRYAAFLVQDERVDAAKAVLAEALERAPENVEVIRNLAVLHLRTESWGEITRLIWKLRSIGSDQATAVANGLEADLLLRQERVDDTITFLEDLVQENAGQQGAALAALVQTKVRAGQIDEATALVDQRLSEDPDNLGIRFMRAGLYLLAEERVEAEEIYKGILEDVPGHARVLRTVFVLMQADGRADEAVALLDDQIAKAENPTAALLLKAEWLERNRDFEGAIAIYDDLYAQNSANLLVANNLASLITTHRDSEEDLNRALAIAQRFRSSNVPALQDTYGWIEYRRGNYEEAVKYLEPAASGMAEHALVQYHLGMVYTKLGRNADAREVLQRAIDLAGDEPLPQFENAREVLKTLPGE